jgi:hypothetical protein
VWLNSDEDKVFWEEEPDNFFDEEYDSEAKSNSYLNEVTDDEVFENNKNYTFNTA